MCMIVTVNIHESDDKIEFRLCIRFIQVFTEKISPIMKSSSYRVITKKINKDQTIIRQKGHKQNNKTKPRFLLRVVGHTKFKKKN